MKKAREMKDYLSHVYNFSFISQNSSTFSHPIEKKERRERDDKKNKMITFLSIPFF